MLPSYQARSPFVLKHTTSSSIIFVTWNSFYSLVCVGLEEELPEEIDDTDLFQQNPCKIYKRTL